MQAPAVTAAVPAAPASSAPAAMKAQPARRRSAPVVVAVIAVVAVAAAGGAYYLMRGQAGTGSAGPTEPATSAPPAVQVTAPGPGAQPPAERKVQPKPAAAAKPQAAAPPAAPSAAVATPPGVPTPPPGAAAPAPGAEKAPDVSYRKVKLVTQAGSSEKALDVVLQFSDDRMSVTPADGGAALRTVRYDEITAASYSQAQKRRLGFIKSAQRVLEIDTAGEPLLLRLDKDNVDAILAAVQARSGRAVSR
jgi:hypothetical protein